MKKHIAAFVLIGQEIAAAAIRAVWNRKRRASEPVSRIDIHNECPLHRSACTEHGCDGTCEIDEEQQRRWKCKNNPTIDCAYPEHWNFKMRPIPRYAGKESPLLGPLAHFVYKDGEFTVGANGMTSQQRQSLEETLAEHGIPWKVEVLTQGRPAYLPFKCPNCGFECSVKIGLDFFLCGCGEITPTNNYRSRND